MLRNPSTVDVSALIILFIISKWDTLQRVSKHQYCNVLQNNNADLYYMYKPYRA